MDFDAKKMYQMCMRKKKYRSEKVAKKMAKMMSEKYGKECYHYWCPLCNNYHLATKKD